MSNTENIEELKYLESQFIFADSKIEADVILSKLIKLLPKDADLGEYIRNIYQNKMWK